MTESPGAAVCLPHLSGEGCVWGSYLGCRAESDVSGSQAGPTWRPSCWPGGGSWARVPGRVMQFAS